MRLERRAGPWRGAPIHPVHECQRWTAYECREKSGLLRPACALSTSRRLGFEVEAVQSFEVERRPISRIVDRIKSRHPLVAACGGYTPQVHKLGWPLKIHEEDQGLAAASPNPATPT